MGLSEKCEAKCWTKMFFFGGGTVFWGSEEMMAVAALTDLERS